MRKLIVLTVLSLDGVMQAPGGQTEDPSGDFKYGGWTVPYWDDFSGKMMAEQLGGQYDLLLGKFTYDIFASYWPHHNEIDPIGPRFNAAKKYVVSHAPMALPWEHSTLITGDVVAQIKALKEQDGPEIQVHGSGNLAQTLMKHDLVDEFWLKIFPVTLGPGKRLFAEGTIPAAYTLTSSKISPKGVIFANYARAGEVSTGSF